MLLLNPGDHVVYMEDVYGGTFRLFDKVLKRFGMTFTAVDASDVDQVEAAMTDKTRMVWLESPTNPLLRVVDIDAVSEVAHSRGAMVCVDNTFATPYLQQPLHLGADVVVHSSTKYIGGHSDVVGGAMMTNSDELEKQLRFHQNAVGAVPSPFDCWRCESSDRARMRWRSPPRWRATRRSSGCSIPDWTRIPTAPSPADRCACSAAW